MAERTQAVDRRSSVTHVVQECRYLPNLSVSVQLSDRPLERLNTEQCTPLHTPHDSASSRDCVDSQYDESHVCSSKTGLVFVHSCVHQINIAVCHANLDYISTDHILRNREPLLCVYRLRLRTGMLEIRGFGRMRFLAELLMGHPPQDSL